VWPDAGIDDVGSWRAAQMKPISERSNLGCCLRPTKRCAIDCRPRSSVRRRQAALLVGLSKQTRGKHDRFGHHGASRRRRLLTRSEKLDGSRQACFVVATWRAGQH
jgi:hypothetical protein